MPWHVFVGTFRGDFFVKKIQGKIFMQQNQRQNFMLQNQWKQSQMSPREKLLCEPCTKYTARNEMPFGRTLRRAREKKSQFSETKEGETCKKVKLALRRIFRRQIPRKVHKYPILYF